MQSLLSIAKQDAEGPEMDLDASRKLFEEVARRQREKARQKLEQEERERIEKKLFP